MDYTTFKKGKGPKSGNEAAALIREMNPGHWWLEDEKDTGARANQMVAAARHLEQDAQDRHQSNLRHARLYGNFDSVGLGIRSYTQSASAPQNKISLNVIAACIDTLAAKIAKNKPIPMFVTDGGSFPEQRQAKALDKFVRGWFYEADVHNKGAEIFLDGCKFDVGALHVYRNEDTGRVCVERVLPDELFVDDAEAVYGEPRQMFRRKYVARENVITGYADEDPARTAAIQGAKPPDDAEQKGFGDVVEVWEAWHLPSREGGKDGLHVIAIDGCELYSEPWKHDYFPFAFFRYSKRTMGFWGQGVAERLTGIQLEINRLLRSVSEQLRRKGRGRIFVKIGSKVSTAHLTNGIADVVFYTGDTPPTVDSANAVAPEEFQQLDRLYQRAFQEIGVSELSAGAKKPSGLDAAVAIREFNDIETERFIMIGKAYEQFFLDLTKIALGMIAETPGNYRVKLVGKSRFEVLSWKDVHLDEDQYVLQMFPISSLPQTPAYRLQRIEELKAGGYITQSTALRLADMPDIDAEMNLALASQDDVDQTISDILDLTPPRLRPVEEFQNLGLLLERTTAVYLRVRHTNIEKERLMMLVTLIDQAREMLKPPMPIEPPGVGGAPGGMLPPGPPMMGPPGLPQGQPMVSVTPTVNMDVDPNFAPKTPPVAPPIAG
jgi:hypothetical protein